jgi:hypothetical protein
VTQLHKSADSVTTTAPDELQRPARNRFIRAPGKDARERLFSEVKDRNQLTVAAYAAGFYRAKILH